MPLSDPGIDRHPIHLRAIESRSFERSDGLWDVEGRLTDTKSYAFPNRHRGTVEIGDPLHDMWLRLTIDQDMRIHAVEAVSDKYPHQLCPSITPAFKKLEGLTIGSGWSKAVRERLGGVHGCTHLVDLLGPMATVAVHTVRWSKRPLRDAREGLDGPAETVPKKSDGRRAGGKPPLNTCHVWDAAGPVVKEEFPEFYTGK